MNIKYQIGQQFRKVGGDYSFEGTIVTVFTKLNGVVRYVGENKDGLLFIFNEASIEPIGGTRKIVVNGRAMFTDANHLSYQEIANLAGLHDFKGVLTMTWHTIGTGDGGSISPKETFTFPLDNDRMVIFNAVNTSNA